MKRFIVVVATLLVAMTSLTVSHATSGFVAGAAVADISPRPFNPANHTLDPPGFDGYRRWDDMEPYIDVNGDGMWTAGDNGGIDPAGVGGGPPEPYADLNHNGRYDGMTLAGGGRNELPATKIADPVTARAFVVENGSHRIAVEVLDTIGTFTEDMDQIRALARAQLPAGALDEIFISATHDESAPDVVGLWGSGVTPVGSGIGNAGVNDNWMNYAAHQAAKAIVDAYSRREAATIQYAETTQPDNFLTCWSSYPYVRASKIPILQAKATSDGHTIVTMMNYGIHAETGAFNGGSTFDPVEGATLDQEKYWISADWPYWARKTLEDQYGGVGIQMANSVGSVETPKIYTTTGSPTAPDAPVTAVPTGQYDPGHPAGCRTIFASSPGSKAIPLGYFQETKELGTRIAKRVISALSASGTESASNAIEYQRKPLFIPLTNALFLGAGVGQVFPRRPFYAFGTEVPGATQLISDPVGTASTYRAPSPDASGPVGVRTEVAEYTIGDAQFITTPGELFPFTYTRGFQGPDDMPYPADAMSAWVTPHMTGKYRFIEGLGEDMIGYMFPKANAVGVPGDRLSVDGINGDDPRTGCGHSDDSEATNGAAGNYVADAANSLLGAGSDAIVTGRYIWPDHSLHRSPLGDGALGCSGTFHVYSPAPGQPIGVVVTNGVTQTVYGLPGSGLSGALAASALVDYNGVAQTTASVDTRGVLLPDGSRVYVDVYPDVTLTAP